MFVAHIFTSMVITCSAPREVELRLIAQHSVKLSTPYSSNLLKETMQLRTKPQQTAGKHMVCTVGFASAKRCLIAAAVVNKHLLIRVHRRPEEVSQQRLYPERAGP